MADISAGNQVPGVRGANFDAFNPANRRGGGITTAQARGELTSIPEPELTSIPGPVTRMKSGNPMGVAVPRPAVANPFGFNVEKFKSTALQRDVMKNNLFLVTVYFPYRLGSSEFRFNPQKQDVELIPLFCSACMLPSVTLITQDIVSRYGYDITEKMPVLPDFQDVPFTFISDGKGEVIKFFDNWVNHIVNFDDTRGINQAKSGPSQNTYQRPYELAYKDDYSATIEIIVYSPRAERIFIYTLYEAFPKSLYNVNLNWSYTNEIATFDVLMTFRNFKLKGFAEEEWSKGSGIGSLSLFQQIVKGATAAQTLSTVLKKPQSIGDVLNLVSAGGAVARGYNFLP